MVVGYRCAFNPNFPLTSSSRVICGEFERQVKLRGLIPQALHPRPLLHGYSQIQYGLAVV